MGKRKYYKLDAELLDINEESLTKLAIRKKIKRVIDALCNKIIMLREKACAFPWDSKEYNEEADESLKIADFIEEKKRKSSEK